MHFYDTAENYLPPKNPIPTASIPSCRIKSFLHEIRNPLLTVPHLYVPPNMAVNLWKDHNIARLRRVSLSSNLIKAQLRQQPRVSVSRQDIRRGTTRVQRLHHIPCATITRSIFRICCYISSSLCTVVTAKSCTLRHNEYYRCYYQYQCCKYVSNGSNHY